MSSVEEIANPGNSSTPVEHKLDASMSSSKTKVRHPKEKSRKGSEVWLHFTKI